MKNFNSTKCAGLWLTYTCATCMQGVKNSSVLLKGFSNGAQCFLCRVQKKSFEIVMGPNVFCVGCRKKKFIKHHFALSPSFIYCVNLCNTFLVYLTTTGKEIAYSTYLTPPSLPTPYISATPLPLHLNPHCPPPSLEHHLIPPSFLPSSLLLPFYCMENLYRIANFKVLLV